VNRTARSTAKLQPSKTRLDDIAVASAPRLDAVIAGIAEMIEDMKFTEGKSCHLIQQSEARKCLFRVPLAVMFFLKKNKAWFLGLY